MKNHVQRFLQDAIDFEMNPKIPFDQLKWKSCDAIQCHIEGLLTDAEYTRVRLQLAITAEAMKLDGRAPKHESN